MNHQLDTGLSIRIEDREATKSWRTGVHSNTSCHGIAHLRLSKDVNFSQAHMHGHVVRMEENRMGKLQVANCHTRNMPIDEHEELPNRHLIVVFTMELSGTIINRTAEKNF